MSQQEDFAKQVFLALVSSGELEQISPDWVAINLSADQKVQYKRWVRDQAMKTCFLAEEMIAKLDERGKL